MSFALFDPDTDFRITRTGNLPHWFQAGVTYFVTFRTEDSVPREVGDLWRRRREDWLRGHGIESQHGGWRRALERLSDEEQSEFHRTFTKEYEDYLDRGHGACVLKRAELSRIVGSSLKHFDGSRYVLSDFVVMPNHVHVLVCLLGETDIEAQCLSWKKYSATQINRALGQRGRFWQEESFDHLVRSPEQFEYLQSYIADNPEVAGLREPEYLHWSRGALLAKPSRTTDIHV
jgi:type I restriction enzyme R subunit